MKIAVAGGTGLVGGKVVSLLKARGDDVVVLARAAGVDLVSGSGLGEALPGVEVIVDVTSLVSSKPKETVAFFGAVARNLQQAGDAAGVRRIVTLSIVGIDGLGGAPYGHYDGKRAQEEATQAGPVPTVILRATQFHNFPGQMIDWTAKAGVLPVPRTPVQTVDVDAVAEHLVRLVDAPVSGDHVRFDLAGPEKQLLADLVKATARARGQRLAVIPAWLPGETPRRVREGVLQASEGAIIDNRTFGDWLAREYPSNQH
jgi:uncharacterized protein YbjT (DUF2867 family)